jgi:hypothetical protein
MKTAGDDVRLWPARHTSVMLVGELAMPAEMLWRDSAAPPGAVPRSSTPYSVVPRTSPASCPCIQDPGATGVLVASEDQCPLAESHQLLGH